MDRIVRTLAPQPVQTKQTGQPEVDVELDKMARAIDSKNLFAGARLIRRLKAFAGTPLRVEHGLGRTPVTWWPCAPSAAATFNQYSVADDRVLLISVSANVTFDLVVL